MLVLTLLLAPLALAASIPSIPADFTKLLVHNSGSLPTSNVAVPAPPQFTIPAGQTKVIATVGRGIQNYTCTAGTWTSIGALANLYDIAPIINLTKGFLSIQQISETLPGLALKALPYPSSFPPADIHHLFVTLPGATAGSPKFETSTASAVLKKINSVDAPNKATDVAWLQLQALDGQSSLASYVYRLYTAGGQPPSSCSTEGDHTSVQYASMYFFTS